MANSPDDVTLRRPQKLRVTVDELETQPRLHGIYRPGFGPCDQWSDEQPRLQIPS